MTKSYIRFFSSLRLKICPVITHINLPILPKSDIIPCFFSFASSLKITFVLLNSTTSPSQKNAVLSLIRIACCILCVTMMIVYLVCEYCIKSHALGYFAHKNHLFVVAKLCLARSECLKVKFVFVGNALRL